MKINEKTQFNYLERINFTNKRSRKSIFSIITIFMLVVIMILSSPMSMINFPSYKTINAQSNLVNNGGSNINGVNLPSLSLYSKSKGQFIEDLKPRSIQMSISFGNPNSGTGATTNNPNFAFTTSQWPSVNHGEILNTTFFSTSPSLQPSNVTVAFVNVLNPLQSTDFNSMQLGSSFILPLSADDRGQYRNFIVSNEIPSGYYLVNVQSIFDNYNVNSVYSGKVYIPVQASSTYGYQQPTIAPYTQGPSYQYKPYNPGGNYNPSDYCSSKNSPDWCGQQCSINSPPSWCYQSCSSNIAPDWCSPPCSVTSPPSWCAQSCQNKNSPEWCNKTCNIVDPPEWCKKACTDFAPGWCGDVCSVGDPDWCIQICESSSPPSWCQHGCSSSSPPSWCSGLLANATLGNNTSSGSGNNTSGGSDSGTSIGNNTSGSSTTSSSDSVINPPPLSSSSSDSSSSDSSSSDSGKKDSSSSDSN